MKWLFGLIFGAVLLMPGLAVAQEAATEISVTPAIIDAPVPAGESVSRLIQITNGSSEALPISIQVQSAVLDGEPLEQGSRERYDVSDWVRFDQDTYIFEPGQTREISFMITAPFTALPGGHYAHISIRSLSLQQSPEGQTSGLVFPEIGVPVLVTVPGEIVEDARVAEGSVFPLFMTSNDELQLEVPIENTGTVHNIVSGRIVLEKDGEFYAEESLQPSVVLPSTRKIVRQNWTSPEVGSYKAYVELQFGTQQKVSRSKAESIVVTPSFALLFWLAIGTWITLYIWPRRKNIKAAVRVIFG